MPQNPTNPISSFADAQKDRPILRALTLAEMTTFLQRAGHPAFRARQLFQWVHEKGADSFDQMTNLHRDLRAWLSGNTHLGGMDRVEVAGDSGDTQKIVYRTDDGEYVESVLMRGEEDEEPEPVQGSTAPLRKVSLCLSSQVGCPLRCAFCMTGYGGFRRDLRVDEILDQVRQARQLVATDERVSNLVFMGMGEPLLNLEVVIPALRLLTAPNAYAFSTRRITVSTAGIIPGIDEFGRAATDVNLAVSLNATTQLVRDKLMPGCKKWPLAELLKACRRFPLTKKRRITFEYVLLKGINDTPGDLKRLQSLLHGIPCKINLILYNPDEVLDLKPTGEEAAEAFRVALVEAHLTVGLRRSKGRQHSAACGQLAAHHFRKRDEGKSHDKR
ncbi:23S rRNA (adenine(2503)-C(2))-methyltransferase RlmN [bacterium]|nr:23S rRNA (adenine(2503)-C(2))-methyltransferase RlmN [bacterium]